MISLFTNSFINNQKFKMVRKNWKAIDVNFTVKTTYIDETKPKDKEIDVCSIVNSLPTTTKSSRKFDDLHKVPVDGPFMLEFSNVSFHADIESIKGFFKQFTLTNIEMNERKRGCGRIEFSNLKDVESALELNGKIFVGRSINLNVITDAEKYLNKETGLRKTDFNVDKNKELDSDNWRIKRHVPVDNEKGCENWRVAKARVIPSNKESEISSDNWKTGKPINSEVKSSNWRPTIINKEVDSDNWRTSTNLQTQSKSQTTEPWRNQQKPGENKMENRKTESNQEGCWRRQQNPK